MGWWSDDSFWIRVIDDVTETFPIGTLRNRCTPINPMVRVHPRNIILIYMPYCILNLNYVIFYRLIRLLHLKVVSSY